MNRRKKLMAVAAGLIAAGACAVGMGTTPAHAAPAAATAWSKTTIVSQRNGQCAFPSADNHLAPIDSVGCTASTWWWCRILNGAAWDVEGDHIECVDQNKTFMFGESGGAFKMETPNSSDYILLGADLSPGWGQLEYVPNDNYFGSGPAGTALGVETTESDGHGWALELPMGP